MIKIERLVDEYIESVTDEREPDGMYHPSAMFLCNRQVIYSVRSVPKTEDVDLVSKRRFYIGHTLHEVVQRAIEASDVDEFYPEFKVNLPDYNIVGAGDVLVRIGDDWWVIEVKSTKKIAVKFGLPKEEHKRQVGIYSWAAKHHGVEVMDEVINEWIPIPPLGDALKGVIIVYLEKEELRIWEYHIEYDPQWDIDIEDKLHELEAYREDPDSLPPRLPLKADGKKPWPCAYCPWKTKCWNADPAIILPKEVF